MMLLNSIGSRARLESPFGSGKQLSVLQALQWCFDSLKMEVRAEYRKSRCSSSKDDYINRFDPLFRAR